jgi:prepilin-type N-terminal cleavage/methylation domain-containing protein/prepilin-type processing-associated H-X9-DG protein
MKRNAGFTLVEYLVVLAIIVILMSLLLPIFVKGREAARRIQCVNNLKQLSLAIQSYQTINNVLPSGVVDDEPASNVSQSDRMSWITSLLPYYEQRYLFDGIDFESSVSSPTNHTIRMTTLSTLICPSSERKRSLYQFVPMSPLWRLPAQSSGQNGTTSYAGVHHDVEASIDVDNHGVFFRNSRVRYVDVADGLSQTLFIGEVAAASPLGWLSGSRATLRNTGHPINRVADDAFEDIELPEDFLAGGMRADVVERLIEAKAIDVPPSFVGGFGSRHEGGANFAFGDGSVRFLKESIDPAVFRLLGNRSDGEAIDDSSY